MSAAACKIILNGDAIQSIVHAVCYRISSEEYAPDAQAEADMVVYLNEMEDLAFKFERRFLESQGFTGPWPHSMTVEE